MSELLAAERGEWLSMFGSADSSLHVFDTDPTDTDLSTAHTVALMANHARDAAGSSIVLDARDEILEHLHEGSSEGELLEATFHWIKERVQFVQDESLVKRLFGIDSGKELLITPERLLTMPHPMGDCDDFSTLCCSLLLSMGIQCDFVTIAAQRDTPDKFSHVYCVATLPSGEKVNLDTSHGKAVGWEAPNIYRKQIWNVLRDEDMLVKRNGLGDGDWGGEAGPPDIMSVPNSGGGFASSPLFSNLIGLFAKTGTQIAQAQFGQPQLAPGTYIRNADGSILTNQPVGGIQFGGGGLGISSNMILVGGLALGAVFLLKGR